MHHHDVPAVSAAPVHSRILWALNSYEKRASASDARPPWSASARPRTRLCHLFCTTPIRMSRRKSNWHVRDCVYMHASGVALGFRQRCASVYHKGRSPARSRCLSENVVRVAVQRLLTSEFPSQYRNSVRVYSSQRRHILCADFMLVVWGLISIFHFNIVTQAPPLLMRECALRLSPKRRQRAAAIDVGALNCVCWLFFSWTHPNESSHPRNHLLRI